MKNVLIGFLALVLVACGSPKDDSGGGGGPTTPTDIKVDTTKTVMTGDFSFSTSLAMEGGKLSFTIPAIADPEDTSKPVDPASVVFNITGKGGKPLTCTVSADSTATKPKVDLVFVTDTTSSMGGTLNGVTTSIASFVDSVSAEGVDMQLGLVAYGDAFATKGTGSAMGGVGPLGTPPSFDMSDRPFLDLTGLDAFKALNASLSATGGGDGAENTLGATQYALNAISWRDGAAKVLFVTGDNFAHVDTRTAKDHWAPPAVADLIAALKGNATVHTIGPNYGYDPFYDFSLLADATSGKKFPLTNPDLVSIKFADWFTKSMKGTCSGIETGTYDIVIVVKIKGITKTFTAKVVLGVTAG